MDPRLIAMIVLIVILIVSFIFMVLSMVILKRKFIGKSEHIQRKRKSFQ